MPSLANWTKSYSERYFGIQLFKYNNGDEKLLILKSEKVKLKYNSQISSNIFFNLKCSIPKY